MSTHYEFRIRNIFLVAKSNQTWHKNLGVKDRTLNGIDDAKKDTSSTTGVLQKDVNYPVISLCWKTHLITSYYAFFPEGNCCSIGTVNDFFPRVLVNSLCIPEGICICFLQTQQFCYFSGFYLCSFFWSGNTSKVSIYWYT